MGCTSLAGVTYLANTPPTIRPSSFEQVTYNNAMLAVPSGKVSTYQTASYWQQFQHFTTVDNIRIVPSVAQGDVNGDTNVDINDVTTLISFVLTGSW